MVLQFTIIDDWELKSSLWDVSESEEIIDEGTLDSNGHQQLTEMGINV